MHNFLILVEYTKIQTPRQDLLFKKGYLCRARHANSRDVRTPDSEPPNSQNGESITENGTSISTEASAEGREKTLIYTHFL